ncbi:MAG: YlbF family regulator [Clostridia bacterium]|nr:YlbF family regulator [Clostridia bacterium]
MDIFNKAKELATAIVQSQELKALRENEENMMNNPTSRQLIEEYQKIQMEVMQEGIEIQDLSEDKQLEIEKIEKEMSQNQYIVDYMEAQEKFEQILRSVNLIISSALNESDSTCSSTGCSGCDGC